MQLFAHALPVLLAAQGGQQQDSLVQLIEAALLGPEPLLASAFEDMHHAKPLPHRGAVAKTAEDVLVFAAESLKDAKRRYVVVANTGEKELEDPVRINVADLGLPPYLEPGLESGPGLNALSGRPYYATDLYTNTSWPLGAGLLGAPKPKGSAAYVVWEAPCNTTMQYSCSRHDEEEVHPYDATLHPIFHLPAGNHPGYVGDPNGMMYREDTGLFHLMWQCDPRSDVRGDFWCHAVSKDYVKWKSLPHALPSGCESGGATQLPNGDVVVVFQHNAQLPRGTVHMQGRPLNLSDPLLLEWGLAPVNTGGADGVGGSDISPAWLSADRKHYLFATGGASMSSTPSVFLWNTTTFRSYGAMGALHTYNWDRCAAYGGNPHFCGFGSYGRDPNFFPVHGSDDDHSDGLRVLEVLQKTGEASGRDFYVLGRWNATDSKFTIQDKKRDVGIAVYDYGNFLASETVWQPERNGKPGRRILTAFAFEGDCDGATYPMACPWAATKRGWGGVITLPRVIEQAGFVDHRGITTHVLTTAPLPELSALRSKTVHAHRNTTMHVPEGEVVLLPTPKDLGNSYEVVAVFELPPAKQMKGGVGEASAAQHNYDFGLQLLWSHDDTEYTKVGLRSTTQMPGVDLVNFADSRGVDKNVTVSRPLPSFQSKTPTQAAEACKLSCSDENSCVAWSARPGRTAPSPMASHSVNASDGWRCAMHKTYPLHATTDKAAVFQPYTDGSISGIRPQKELHFASMYVNREKSSFESINGTRSYGRFGHFEYSGTIWVHEKTEKTVTLRAFVDRSIVEVFSTDGRGAITARVYPTTAPRDLQVGVYADVGAARLKSVDIWRMESALLSEPPVGQAHI
eukprot:COSAG02_NODE_301_length_25237_cov_19.918490_4_plen_852_part_00